MTKKRTEPQPPVPPQEVTPTHCYCGSPLSVSQRCAATGQWPRIVWAQVYRPALGHFEKAYFEVSHQPGVVCPFCRGLLDWDGGCSQCYGSNTPQDRNTWTFPGHRYERQGLHWEEIDGPRKACTREEHKAALAVVQGVLHGNLRITEAFERLQAALQAHGPLPEDPDPKLVEKDL